MSDVERFWAKVDVGDESSCWNWTAAVTRDGYGRFRFPGRHVSAHRFAYELMRDPIPPGLDLDHLCRNRRCVNPSHLQPVTERENTLRGVSVVASNARKTHCIHGHPLAGENLYPMPAGGRGCRACRSDARRAHAARARAGKVAS